MTGVYFYIAIVVCYNARMGERQIIQQRNLTFILDDRITVSTGFQTFHLEAADHRWKIRMSAIREQIESGEIETINDLASACRGKIKWVTSYRD